MFSTSRWCWWRLQGLKPRPSNSRTHTLREDGIIISLKLLRRSLAHEGLIYNFSDFRMAWKWYMFNSDPTSNFEFWPFPELVTCGTLSLWCWAVEVSGAPNGPHHQEAEQAMLCSGFTMSDAFAQLWANVSILSTLRQAKLRCNVREIGCIKCIFDLQHFHLTVGLWGYSVIVSWGASVLASFV